MEGLDSDSKLALIASIFEDLATEKLLEALEAANGNVETAIERLSRPIVHPSPHPKRKEPNPIEAPVRSLELKWNASGTSTKKRKVEHALHLYLPDQIEKMTPCSLITNILPTDLANSLLQGMLTESQSWQKGYFKLFNRTVTSPHVSSFYLQPQDILNHSAYTYNGQALTEIRPFSQGMTAALPIIQDKVNILLQDRETYFMKHWEATVAFANLYEGSSSSVGYHSDQLSYLGPLPIIASLSLGCTREFRLKPVAGGGRVMSIHLPHNSLLIMWGSCQEDWKHSIHGGGVLDLHPIARNKRINITYRMYRDEYRPEKLPRCKCGQVVLRSARRKADEEASAVRGEDMDGNLDVYGGRRYFWHCDGDKRPEGEGCGYFKWAEFDEHGVFRS